MNKIKIIVLVCVLFFAFNAQAVTSLKIDLGGTGPDFQFDGTTLSTVNDGNLAKTGDQNTVIDFVSFLDEAFSDYLNGASFSLNGVLATGAPIVVGTLVSQSTTSGTFNIYDLSNVFLLSGVLNDGAIFGSNTASSGSFLTLQSQILRTDPYFLF